MPKDIIDTYKPPKASDQKRKRGRPPGASRVEHDASTSEAPIANDEPDAEEQARPRKRGRRTGADNASTVPGAAAQDGPARRGRPPKTSQQDAARNTETLPERQGKGTGRNQEEATNKSTRITKGKKEKQQSQDARAEEEEQSSGLRRSGRERRPLNSDEVVGSNRQSSLKRRLPENESNDAAPVAAGATQDKVEVGKSKRKRNGNGKAVQGNESRAEDGSSSPNPRRGARERRTRDPTQVFKGRPDDGNEAQSTSPAEDAKPRQKRAGASPKDGVTSKAQKRGHGAKTGNTQPKRGRPRVGIADGEEGRALQPQQGNRSKAPGKASKGANTSVATGSEEKGSQLKRRGRPEASADQSQASGQDQPSEARLPVRGRPAKPREDQDETRPKPKRQQPQPQPKQLEPVPEESESPEPEEEFELPFRHLREATRNVSRHTISEKWNALDGPSINAVGAFLADAQRPVLLRLQDTGRRREHASSALSTVSRRLRSKLVKGFPFPAPTAGAPNRAGQGSYEDEFDFERIVDAIQTLESTLNPLQHSVGLLEREIKREEDALAKDYDNLHKLEANARSEAKGWREKARREHVLAPGIKKKGEDGDDEVPRDNLELVPRTEDDASGGLFKGLQDEELVAISKQLGSHMESMKGNLQQIGGVVPAITRTKAALQQVLLKRLDDEQYERVLVG